MKLVFVQNIVAPYRTYLFNKMTEMGVDIEVYYQSLTEKDRSWKIDLNELKHPHWIDKHGIYFCIKGYHVHHNPMMIWKILKLNRNYYVQIPGWGDIDAFILCLLKKMHLVRCRFNYSCEATYLGINGPSRKNFFKDSIRKFVMSCIDGYAIIPGKMPIIALKHFGVNTDKLRFAILPNVIQDDQLVYKGVRTFNEKPIFVISARLIENIKGMLNFWRSIGDDNIRKCIFMVAGDGIDQKLYENFISDNKLENHIKLLGFMNVQEINNLYNKADAFLLSSFYDSSPLTLVEATKMGLPILASNHCGNHFECVEPGKNGETFDPCDPSDIKKTFERFMNEKEKWPEYSKRSKEIYAEKFAPEVAINNFISQIDYNTK